MQYPRYVYALQNKSNGKIYVGSAFDLNNRYYKHMNLLSKNEHFAREMQSDYNKGNVEFDLFLLDEIFCEEEMNKEYQWMKRLHSSVSEGGYNTTVSNPHHIPSFVKHGIPEIAKEKETITERKFDNGISSIEIGKIIKKSRIENGMKQNELASKVGKVKTTICNWEKGYVIPSYEMLVKLSELLDIPLSCFYEQKKIYERSMNERVSSN